MVIVSHLLNTPGDRRVVLAAFEVFLINQPFFSSFKAVRAMEIMCRGLERKPMPLLV